MRDDDGDDDDGDGDDEDEASIKSYVRFRLEQRIIILENRKTKRNQEEPTNQKTGGTYLEQIWNSGRNRKPGGKTK